MRPDARTTSISIRLSIEERDNLEKYCKENDITVSALVRSMIKPYTQPNN